MALGSINFLDYKIATYTFSEASQTKHIERIAPSAGIVSGWEATKSVSDVGAVAAFSLACVGKGRIVIGATATSASSAKDDSVSFRLVFKDASGLAFSEMIVAEGDDEVIRYSDDRRLI